MCRFTTMADYWNQSQSMCKRALKQLFPKRNHTSRWLGSSNHANRSHCAAFTMMEVVFAMAIIGFLVVALYAAIATSVGLVKSCQENERVTQILSEKMDTIRLYNWDQIRSNGFVATNFTVVADPLSANSTPYYTGQIAVVQAPVGSLYRSNLLQVTVNVNWVSGSRPQNRSMTTFVARYGLNSPYL